MGTKCEFMFSERRRSSAAPGFRRQRRLRPNFSLSPYFHERQHFDRLAATKHFQCYESGMGTVPSYADDESGR
jgi:hypothetical protein